MKLPKPSHKYGYTKKEVLDIIRPLKIHHRKFWKVFGVNTCLISKDGDTIFFPIDVERTLASIIRFRKVFIYEFD